MKELNKLEIKRFYKSFLDKTNENCNYTFDIEKIIKKQFTKEEIVYAVNHSYRFSKISDNSYRTEKRKFFDTMNGTFGEIAVCKFFGLNFDDYKTFASTVARPWDILYKIFKIEVKYQGLEDFGKTHNTANRSTKMFKDDDGRIYYKHKLPWEREDKWDYLINIKLTKDGYVPYEYTNWNSYEKESIVSGTGYCDKGSVDMDYRTYWFTEDNKYKGLSLEKKNEKLAPLLCKIVLKKIYYKKISNLKKDMLENEKIELSNLV